MLVLCYNKQLTLSGPAAHVPTCKQFKKKKRNLSDIKIRKLIDIQYNLQETDAITNDVKRIE